MTPRWAGHCRRLRASVALGLALWATPARAVERDLNEVWPELNVFVQLDERSRLMLLGALTRAAESGTSTEGTLGVHYDWFPQGLPARLVTMAPRLQDDWSIWTRVGYQRIEVWNTSGTTEHRLLAEATLRSEPLWQSIKLANRMRFDFRFIDRDESWRFRNRFRIERSWTLGEKGSVLDRMVSGLLPDAVSAVTPYAMLEFFWDSRESDWTRRLSQIGLEFETQDNQGLDLYLGRQDDVRRAGSTVRILGIAYTIRF